MRQLHLRFTLAASLLLTSLFSFQPAVSAPPAAPSEPAGLLAALTSQAGDDLRVGYHAGTGLVNFIGGTPSQPAYHAPATAAALGAPDGARGFLASYGSLFGLKDPDQQLSVMRDRALEDGRAVVRFQQQHAGVPVMGGELIVQMDAGRNVISAGGEVLPDIALDTTPALDAAAAEQRALDLVAQIHGVPVTDLRATAPALWVYNPVLLRSNDKGATRLVWRMDVTTHALSDIRELVLVDAHFGKIALHFNQTHSVLQRRTYHGNNGVGLPGTLHCADGGAACVDSHAAAAHLHAGQTYTYYLSMHGRDSIDGAGMTLTSTVHHRSNYENAFWDGVQMVYGDGADFPLADDVVAHELTHGVTQYESNLYYYYQSGAINESFSDVWGEFVDLANGVDDPADRWQIGEDVTGWVFSPLRDMQDPTVFNDPDRMTSPYYNEAADDDGDNDWGGVHSNSGVNNKAAYLMADGGTFNGRTVTGLGLTKTINIYYEVQTNLLTSGADYLDLYNALNQACADLIGTADISAADCVEVQDATEAVEMNLQPVANYNTEAEQCIGGGTPDPLFFDNLETASAAWTMGMDLGSSQWDYFTGFAHSGTQSLWGEHFRVAVGATNSYATLNPGLGPLPAGAYLHFYHAYGFEGPNYDGGVLEYSTNDGGTWLDLGSQIQSHGYGGTLAATNPLGARSAFIGDSHGYIATRVSLASLAGQTVRFRWRMATDNSVTDQGWWVDDVTIYTCSAGPATLTTMYLPLLTRINPVVAVTNILQEGFEGSFPSGLWQVSDPGYDEYYWAQRNCRARSGSYSAWAIGGGSIGGGLGCGANYVDYTNAWMVYGPVSLVGATDAELNYFMWLNTEPSYDGICIYASVNGNDFGGDCWTGSTGGNWASESLDLTNVYALGDLRGQPSVWIAFRLVSDESVVYSEGAHIDDITLRMCTGGVCPTVAAASAQSSGLTRTPSAATLDAGPPDGSRD